MERSFQQSRRVLKEQENKNSQTHTHFVVLMISSRVKSTRVKRCVESSIRGAQTTTTDTAADDISKNNARYKDKLQLERPIAKH